MTRMIPPTVHSSVKSPAERRLFRVIQEAPGSELWTCLHSLGLAHHEYKRRAEIDFCLITPEGIFVLEVKGGRVSRQAGVWKYTDRYGNVYTKSESPFDQAASAMFALEKELSSHVRSTVESTCFGYGVLFPDIEFNEYGTEVAPQQVFDKRDRRRPFSDYVRRLAKYSRSLVGKSLRKLRKEDIDTVVTYLRGDFDLLPLIGSLFNETSSALTEVTQEQMLVLDAAADCRRLIVNGAAGSGKTLLAIESARRAARQGLRVTYLCYNKYLAAMVEAHLLQESFPVAVRVCTLHREFHDLIEASSLYEEFSEIRANVDEEELFQSVYPDFAALAAMEIVGPAAEVLIIDEAQDVLTDANLRALNEILKDGLRDGQWQVFLDVNDQASVYKRMEERSLTEIRSAAEREVLLTLNCRNTRPIGIQINVVAQPRQRTMGRVDGPPVEFLTYRSDDNIMGKLEYALNEIRSEGVPLGRISVLFPEIPSASQQNRLAQLGLEELEVETAPLLGSDVLERTTWSAVSGFKGLENDVVVVVGVRDIESEWWRSVCYIALSRARVRLFVIVHDDATPIREERFAAEMAKTFQTEA